MFVLAFMFVGVRINFVGVCINVCRCLGYCLLVLAFVIVSVYVLVHGVTLSFISFLLPIYVNLYRFSSISASQLSLVASVTQIFS